MGNYKQQIGGYFSSTNASKDEALKDMVAARISEAEDKGMLLPAGSAEYFSVTPESIITGTANVSSIE